MSTSGRRSRFDRTVLAVGGIVLAVVLFLSLNLTSWLTLGAQRVDLTENRLFTVTDTTRQVLAQVKEPITLRVYQSQQLMESVPRLKVYADRVIELLRTYQQLSGNRLRIERINPLSFSADEDRALRYGLQGVPLDRSGERGYLGLVGTNSVDDLEKIEFLSPEREPFLEYDLTRIVHRLSNPDVPRVAIIDGMGVFGSRELGRYPWAFLDLITKSFRIQQVPYDVRAIPKDANVLVVIHPNRLPPALRYAVDQYVLGGGAALVFLDPLAENSPPNPMNPQQLQIPTSELDPIMQAWGVEMIPAKVVADRAMALRITGFAGQQRVMADYVPWLRVREDSFNPDDVVTAQLQVMRMSSAGALRQVDGATTAFVPLIQTTTESMLLDELDVRRRPNPNELLSKFVSSGKRQVLAARIAGNAKTAFPEGPPPYEPDPQAAGRPPPAPGPHVAQSAKPINVVVVADVDMLGNSHVVGERGQPNSSNSDFVMNALENLAGGNAMIGLRGRGLSIRPFSKVEEIEARAEATYRATEQRLSAQLEETQQQLSELQMPGQPASGDFQALTREQQDTIARFNRQMIDLRQQLRDVRAALRGEIDSLERWLKMISILFVPGVVVILGILAALWQRARLSRQWRRRGT